MSGEVVHRLGMALAVVSVLMCAAALGQARRDRALRRRMAVLLGAGPRPRRGRAGRRGRRRDRPAVLRTWLLPVTVVPMGIILVGGLGGFLLGLAGAYGLVWWRRRRAAQEGAKAAAEGAVAPRLPLAADLLAACLAAGAGPGEAAEAVGRSLGGQVGRQLAQAAAELRLGAEPAEAWGRVGALPGAARLADCLERAGTTGVPAVEAVARLAADCRADQSRAAGERAGRAQVLTTAPLGLCFLPAFLLTGVVPMVVGLSGGLANAH